MLRGTILRSFEIRVIALFDCLGVHVCVSVRVCFSFISGWKFSFKWEICYVGRNLYLEYTFVHALFNFEMMKSKHTICTRNNNTHVNCGIFLLRSIFIFDIKLVFVCLASEQKIINLCNEKLNFYYSFQKKEVPISCTVDLNHSCVYVCCVV